MLCTHCSDEVKPIVAVDIDGTLADYHRHFLKFACQWLGREDDKKAMGYTGGVSLAEHLDIPIHTYREIKLAFRQGGMKRSAPMFPGARDLCLMLRNLGVELWITTTRPYLRLDNIDPDTREWLRRNDIDYDHLFYDEDKYAQLLLRVDRERVVAVLDDELENIVRASELGLPTVWRRAHANRDQSAPDLLAASGLSWQAATLPDAYSVIRKLVQKWEMRT